MCQHFHNFPPTLWKVAATIYCYMGSTVSTAATAANGEQFDKSDFLCIVIQKMVASDHFVLFKN